MKFCRAITFRGTELELLQAMSRAGCVLDNGKHFHCTLEDGNYIRKSRLPAVVRGICDKTDGGWNLRYCVLPSFRSGLLGLVPPILLAFSLMNGAWVGAALCGIIGALVWTFYAVQVRGCLHRFESILERRQ